MRRGTKANCAAYTSSLPEKVEKRLLKPGGSLDLRGVAEVRKLGQLRMRYARRSRLAEHGVISKCSADRRRRQIFANSGRVFVSHDQLHRHRNLLKLVIDRLSECHVIGQ